MSTEAASDFCAWRGGAGWVRAASSCSAVATAFACWLPFQLGRGDVGLYDRMGLYALVAIGLTLLMGFAGQVSLGQGGFFLIGAYTSGLLTVGLDPATRLVDPEAGIDPLLALAIAPARQRRRCLLIGIPLMRLRGHYLAFATLAFALIAWSLLYAQDRFTGGQYGVTVTKRLAVGRPRHHGCDACRRRLGPRRRRAPALDEPRRVAIRAGAAGDRRERACGCRFGDQRRRRSS